MFTGLIQALGTTKIQEQNCFEITVAKGDRSTILSDLAIGDSVAVDGVCLTVETLLPQGFIATASPETIQRTTLSKSDRISHSYTKAITRNISWRRQKRWLR